MIKLTVSRYQLMTALFAFAVGFVASHLLWPRLFGYRTAEECAVQTTHRAAAQACYGLYPTVEELKEQQQAADFQKQLEREEPGRYRALTRDEAAKLEREGAVSTAVGTGTP